MLTADLTGIRAPRLPMVTERARQPTQQRRSGRRRAQEFNVPRPPTRLEHRSNPWDERFGATVLPNKPGPDGLGLFVPNNEEETAYARPAFAPCSDVMPLWTSAPREREVDRRAVQDQCADWLAQSLCRLSTHSQSSPPPNNQLSPHLFDNNAPIALYPPRSPLPPTTPARLSRPPPYLARPMKSTPMVQSPLCDSTPTRSTPSRQGTRRFALPPHDGLGLTQLDSSRYETQSPRQSSGHLLLSVRSRPPTFLAELSSQHSHHTSSSQLSAYERE